METVKWAGALAKYWEARKVGWSLVKRSGRNHWLSAADGGQNCSVDLPFLFLFFSFLLPMPFLQEPHSRGHLSRPEAQSLSPYTTSANRAKLLAKNRQTFLLQTTKLTRLARRMCRDLLQPRRAARRPYAPINANAIKAECKDWSGSTSSESKAALARAQGLQG